MSIQYRAVSVRPELLDSQALGVWQESLQSAGDMGRKLEWFYDSPAGSGQLYVLRTSADSSDAAIGGMGFGIRQWKVGERSVRTGLMADLAVVRAHRTARPALALARTVVEAMRGCTELGYGFPNRSAVGVLRRSGCRPIGEMVRYALVIHSENHLRRVLRFAYLSRLVASVPDAARAALAHARARGPARSWRLESCASPDSEFDALWERAKHDYPMVGCRDAAFLKWRFMQHPWGAHELMAMVPVSAGRLVTGYAVTETVGNVLHVRDLFARRADLDPLLDLLVAHAVDQHVATLSVVSLERGHLTRLLVAKGFRIRNEGTPVVVDPGCRAALADPAACEPARWYLTEADEDI
ncbi:MAG: hypothetical protein JW940_18845 [Polyangiaceae bacterium]|nr:hypothetical protein [Polyangiaceae bacterium]